MLPDYVELTKDHLKLFKIAKNAGDSETLGRIYFKVDKGEKVIALVTDGFRAVEKQHDLPDGSDLKELSISWEYAERVFKIMGKGDVCRLYEDKAEIYHDNGEDADYTLVAVVPQPSQQELDLSKFPYDGVETMLAIRKEARRVFVDAGSLAQALEQFVYQFNSKDHPPKVWLEVEDVSGHVRISSSKDYNNDVIRAAVSQMSTGIEDTGKAVDQGKLL